MDALKFSWMEWLPWRPWRISGAVDAADEVPDRLPPRAAVFVGTSKHPKWLMFDCPCEDNHRIAISLDPDTLPHWRVTSAPKLSLWPSVDAWRGHNRCHYVLRKGRVIWVHGTEET